MYLERDRDTICALSTAPGLGGIAVIRISGADALNIVARIAPSFPGHPKSHQLHLCQLIDPHHKLVIDEALICYFQQGKSYTGDTTIEISCHGSPIICQEILRLLTQCGARLAERGEFTYRAFINQRIDLAQAEGVLDLIESKSPQAARLAMRQLQGEYSQLIKGIEDQMTWVLAHLEANIDFAAEDIEVASSGELSKKLQSAHRDISHLLQSFSHGKMIRDGVQVGIMGRPNVGKSSLLNRLLHDEKAIVSEFPGTTRDFVEGSIAVSGGVVHFTDTAGLRSTQDPVEKVGIERVLKRRDQWDLIFYLIDASVGFVDEDEEYLEYLNGERLVVLVNKSDLIDQAKQSSARDFVLSSGKANLLSHLPPDKFFWISAQMNRGFSEIQTFLQQFCQAHFFESSAAMTNARHAELLRKAEHCLARSIEQVAKAESPEFIIFELQAALRAVHEILGIVFDDQVMDRVFKEFCLGK